MLGECPGSNVRPGPAADNSDVGYHRVGLRSVCLVEGAPFSRPPDHFQRKTLNRRFNATHKPW